MDHQSHECFKIFYTKHINRKKKTYSEGILVCKEKSAKLYDSDGQCILNFKNKEKPILDEQYLINNSYLILVDQKASFADFETGKIFINEPIPAKVKAKPVVKKQKDDVQMKCGLFMEKHLFEILRKHQVEGVQFMFQCLTGKKKQNLQGCILADFMGLGKTLQTLALSYSMLKQNIISKFIIVCPLTLLSVWERQTKKWLQTKLNPLVCYGNLNEIQKIVKTYISTQYRMLIISYESFYRCSEKLSGKSNLVVFDEGHRLKNKKSKLISKIRCFKCEKRVILSGTPIQNNLQQLFTCISIIYPQMFNSQTIFKNVFQKPILQGMAKMATGEQKLLARERTLQLANQLKQFSLRRTSDVLEQYLPKKREHFIFFRLTPLQKIWYKRIIQTSDEVDTFRTLNELRKLFTHPTILKSDKIDKYEWIDFQEHCLNEISYKINFILDIVGKCMKNNEKIVIVSYYTQTLDFIGKQIKEKGFQFAILDGRSKGSDRYKIIQQFEKEKPILLLSGKAGGTGLTLTCARNMIMIEPDWNPSNDSQVMGRVWRQGQEQEVKIYRLVIACSFEQKMLERQGLKQNLSDRLIDNRQGKDSYDFGNLGKLFIENKEEVTLFRKDQNKLQSCKEEFENMSEGIIFVKINESHQKKENFVNQFQNLNFFQKQDPEQSVDTQEDDDTLTGQQTKPPLKISKIIKKQSKQIEQVLIPFQNENLQQVQKVLVKKSNGKIDEHEMGIPLALKKIRKNQN